ncbi:MAG: DUF2948 family protein [Pseudomonadota bacterium]
MATEDARFEDGEDRPLNLKANAPEDLEVISSLLQDAVFPGSEMSWDQKRRQFAMLVNRFRWEDKPLAERRNRPYERVQSLLVVGDVGKVQSQGVDRSEKDMVLSLLGLTFEPGPDGTGRVLLTLAGDGTIALDVECLDVVLRDVTRPYIAPSGKAPDHPD